MGFFIIWSSVSSNAFHLVGKHFAWKLGIQSIALNGIEASTSWTWFDWVWSTYSWQKSNSQSSWNYMENAMFVIWKCLLNTEYSQLFYSYLMFFPSIFQWALQLITTTRSLVLCADSRREMEDWLTALKAASLREYYEPGLTDTQDFLANHHHWFISSGHRPTYCNVCRDLSKYSHVDMNVYANKIDYWHKHHCCISVTSHGLSCEVCKCKAHKRCAAKAIANW